MSDDEEEIEDKQIGDYILNDELGSGGFGKVVLGTHIPTGEKVAIKIMDKEQILSDELNKERVLNEISILKIVRHNNIIKLYEVMETPQKIYLVMEYCDNGEMFDYIVAKQHLTEEQACVFFQEIIDALTYLHSQKIVHRDVKPENILLQTFGNTLTTKLIDFGISRTYTLDKLISTPCGTASYAPPEMHRGEEYYGLLSDVWSAGVLLYAMVFGYLPFCEEDEEVNIDNIIKGNYEIPEDASPDLRDLIKHIMDIDPLTRYDLDQIKKHPWYNLVSPPKSYPGLIIGYHKIPIDERILKVCEAYGFNKDEVQKSVKENKYDNKSSIYYIILAKMKREGYDSISDLFSQEYINYINDKNNIIDKKDEKEEKVIKENENKEDNKQKGLDLLSDVLKNETPEKEQKNNNNLEQISSNKNLKTINNELKDEISVSSENSKNIIEKDNAKEKEQEKEKNIKKEENNELHSNKVSKSNSSKSLNNEENNKKTEEILITLDDKINKDNIEIKEEEINNKQIKLEEVKKEEEEINKNNEITPTITEITLEEEKKDNINIPQIQKEIPEIKINIETKPKEEKVEKEEIIQLSPIETFEDDKKPIIVLTEKNEQEKEKKDINISIPITIKEKENVDKEKKNVREETQKRKVIEPKHSFYINLNTKKLLMQESGENEYDTENMNPNRLNSSFTQKLTDTLKENVFKMRNPKAKIPNKAKEINNALKEIKQNKKGKKVKKNKENIKNKNKIKKIAIEPLFKGSKKNEHTIIHNRNASMNPERKKNLKINNNDKINNNKNKVNKNSSSSMEKNNKNNIRNKNIDLNNNIKKVKIGTKTKEKDKDKGIKETSVTKRKNPKMKRYDKFVNKNAMTIKKNDINSLSSALLTVSNTKHNRIKSSLNTTNKKIDLKTPSKNLNKVNFEPLYKKVNSSSVKKDNNKKNNLSQTGNLGKAIQLSEVKESNKINKFSYKNSIRINFKKIDQEEFIRNDISNKTSFAHHKVKSNENLSVSLKKYNINTAEKRKVGHKKSNSIEINANSKLNKYINSYQNHFKVSYKYTPLLYMDKNQNKIKKFINLTSYDGPIKTDISSNDIKGNQKFWKKKQEEQILKECYYKGPIDLKNIYFGTSSEEIQEILVGILIKNRIKFWKMNSFRFYCKKNGESFVIRIHILSNKIKSNNNTNLNKSKEEIKVSEFEINKKNENDEIKINGENNMDKYMLFYICVLSKESNNKTQAKQITKILNKKFSEVFKK